MKKRTDFEAMDYMAGENQDIRMTGNVVRAIKTKQGGEVTIGVDNKSFNDIAMDNKHIVALYVINHAQFLEAKQPITAPVSKKLSELAGDEKTCKAIAELLGGTFSEAYRPMDKENPNTIFVVKLNGEYRKIAIADDGSVIWHTLYIPNLFQIVALLLSAGYDI